MNEDKKQSILVVDDENSNIMALSHILSSEYTVYAAKNGQDAIAAAEKYLPDVILLDIIMPEVDGYAVIAALKESDKMKDIPVIFITALSNSEDEEKGLALGAADYISKPFSPAIVNLRIKNQIKILDQFRIIERLGMTDQLTDLPNRRSFNVCMKMEWSQSIREHMPISLLMIDVDRFKNYNDTYGHQQGDVALHAVAQAIAEVVKRSSDFAARWGGEEFAVLLPNTDENGAFCVSERIRKHIENMEIPCADGPETKVTVSVGINTQVPSQNSSYDDFISSADKALYKAKKTGRNKVCAYSKDDFCD